MDTDKILELLGEPFPQGDVKWMPKITNKKNGQPITDRQGNPVAGAIAYIDARTVIARLNKIVGWGWSDSYTPSATGQGVECQLTIEGVTRSDVGSESNIDADKGAYSDALKRAAVKFGIGRELYDMEMAWMPYDPVKKKLLPVGVRKQPAQKRKPPKSKPLAETLDQPPADVGMPEDEFAATDKPSPPTTATINKNDYWDSLTSEEKAVYRSGNNVLPFIGNLPRYIGNDHATNAVWGLFSDTIPSGKTAEDGRARVILVQRVTAYASLRDAGMSKEKAITGALSQATGD